MFAKSFIQIDSILNILFPRACLLCQTFTRSAHHLCQACAEELPILSHSCEKCAQYICQTNSQGLICGQCLANPPPYDKVYALYPYKPPIPAIVAAFKFNEQFCAGRLFASMMQKAVSEWYSCASLPDLIIPMPLHPYRLRERGFNQAYELAAPIGRKLHIKIDQSVTRKKATAPQRTLKKSERAANVANAFSISRAYHGLHVVILDDVMTTGETVTALARLIRAAGARRVDIWCCARCDDRAT